MTFQVFGYAHLTGFKTWDNPEHPAFTYHGGSTPFIGIAADEYDGQAVYSTIQGRVRYTHDR